MLFCFRKNYNINLLTKTNTPVGSSKKRPNVNFFNFSRQSSRQPSTIRPRRTMENILLLWETLVQFLKQVLVLSILAGVKADYSVLYHPKPREWSDFPYPWNNLRTLSYRDGKSGERREMWRRDSSSCSSTCTGQWAAKKLLIGPIGWRHTLISDLIYDIIDTICCT